MVSREKSPNLGDLEMVLSIFSAKYKTGYHGYCSMKSSLSKSMVYLKAAFFCADNAEGQ